MDHQIVAEARKRAIKGDNVYEMSIEYGVDYYKLLQAIRGESHGNVGVPPVSVKSDKPRKTKLSRKDVEDILAALENPYWGINEYLRKKYQVSHGTISRIRHGNYPLPEREKY